MSVVDRYLKKAEEYHGHICSGQILGVRMALVGLKELGYSPDDDLHDIIIYLETDRCVADAAHVVTGITVGQRRIKMNSYGKTAMSFLDVKTGRAVRVCVKTSDRPPHHSPKEEQLAFWEKYSDKDIFAVQEVTIDIDDSELPGPPVSVVTCEKCGEDILDRKEIVKDGHTYCRGCLEGAYYRLR